MKIFKTRDVKTPTRGTEKSAGLDFYVPTEFGAISLQAGQSVNMPSGIKAEVPRGFALIVMNKSGVAIDKGLQVGACVIDEDYQGEIHLHVTNISRGTAIIKQGEKLVQMLIVPVMYDKIDVVNSEIELFPEISERGEGRFGSTGKN